MSSADFILVICIAIGAAVLLYRALRKQWTCSGCSSCSCGHNNGNSKGDV